MYPQYIVLYFFSSENVVSRMMFRIVSVSVHINWLLSWLKCNSNRYKGNMEAQSLNLQKKLSRYAPISLNAEVLTSCCALLFLYYRFYCFNYARLL